MQSLYFNNYDKIKRTVSCKLQVTILWLKTINKLTAFELISYSLTIFIKGIIGKREYGNTY